MTKKTDELQFKQALASRLAELRNINNLSLRKVAEDTGLPPSSLLDWERGTVTPNIIKLTCLAEYYGVSLDYFVGRTNEERGNYSNFNYKTLKHKEAIEKLIALKNEDSIDSAYNAIDAIYAIDDLTEKFKKFEQREKERENKK